MATQIQTSPDRLRPVEIPKHGPNWTFYAYTALAVLIPIATYVGFHIAGLGR